MEFKLRLKKASVANSMNYHQPNLGLNHRNQICLEQTEAMSVLTAKMMDQVSVFSPQRKKPPIYIDGFCVAFWGRVT